MALNSWLSAARIASTTFCSHTCGRRRGGGGRERRAGVGGRSRCEAGLQRRRRAAGCLHVSEWPSPPPAALPLASSQPVAHLHGAVAVAGRGEGHVLALARVHAQCRLGGVARLVLGELQVVDVVEALGQVAHDGLGVGALRGWVGGWVGGEQMLRSTQNGQRHSVPCIKLSPANQRPASQQPALARMSSRSAGATK